MPPAWLLAALATQGLLAWLLPIAEVVPWPWNSAGLLLVAGGIGLAAAADGQFKRHRTTVKPFQPSTTLVTGGAFRLSRNPMYLGLVLVLLGVAVGSQALSPYVVCLGFALLMQLRFVAPEEVMLHEQFGDAYTEYLRRVRRWV